MPKEFIVAIELGSSKMTGIAGQKNLDGQHHRTCHRRGRFIFLHQKGCDL